MHASAPTRSEKLLTRAVLGLVFLDVSLLFFVVHDRWFFERPEGEFLLTALDATTLRIGQILVVVAILIGLYAGVMPSTETIEQKLLDALRLVTRRSLVMFFLTVLLSASAITLIVLFYDGPRFFPRISQGSSELLITPDGSEIYLALRERGTVLWQDLQSPHAEPETIEIGQGPHGELQSIQVGQETGTWTPGQPSQLAYVAPTDQILVTDLKFNSVVVISRRTHRPVHIISGVGFAPRSIVVTPDGQKAYVASEQPIPTGQIAIIDLLAKPYPQLQDKKISVPSPEGMTIRGRRLYVATQSGANHDAVFLVDTTNDHILNWIPGFAVGETPAVVGSAGNKLYVTRGNFPLAGNPTKTPLGVLSISSDALKALASIPLDFNITVMTVTEDGRTAVVANGNRLTAIDADEDQERLSVTLRGGPTGLAISHNRVYAWIPQMSQLFTFDLRSLLPGAKQ